MHGQRHGKEIFIVSPVQCILVTSGEPNGIVGRGRQWSPSRLWTIIIAIAVCAMFILVFVLVAIGDSENQQTDRGSFPRKTAIPFGFRFTFFPSSSSHTSWTDITFQLSTGGNTISWANLTTQDLNSHQDNQTWHFGHPQTLGSLSIWFNVTDLSGDGKLNNGDSITFTTGSDAGFSSDSVYTLVLQYEPTDGSMMSFDFTG